MQALIRFIGCKSYTQESSTYHTGTIFRILDSRMFGSKNGLLDQENSSHKETLPSASKVAGHPFTPWKHERFDPAAPNHGFNKLFLCILQLYSSAPHSKNLKKLKHEAMANTNNKTTDTINNPHNPRYIFHPPPLHSLPPHLHLCSCALARQHGRSRARALRGCRASGRHDLSDLLISDLSNASIEGMVKWRWSSCLIFGSEVGLCFFSVWDGQIVLFFE